MFAVHRSSRRTTCRPWVAALTAVLAAPLLVLAPLSAPAAASGKSAVSVSTALDLIYEGDEAVFTISATLAPTSDLAVSYFVDDNFDTVPGHAEGRKTATIRAGTSSVTVRVPTNRDMTFHFSPEAGKTLYCKNNADGVPVTNVDHVASPHWQPYSSVCAQGSSGTLTGAATVAIYPGSAYTTDTGPQTALISVKDRSRRPPPPPPPDPPPPPPPTPVVQFGSAAYTAGEAAGSRTVSVALSVSPAPTASLAVAYTVGGTAASGADFTALAGTVSVAKGTASATIAVTVNDDALDEDAETIILTLTDGAAYDLGSTKKATVTVADDDTAGVSVTESGAGTSVAEKGGTDTYTVVLGSQPTHDVTVTVTSPTPAAAKVHTTGGTAATSTTLTFAPSAWDQAQTVTVTGVNDDIDNQGDQRTVAIAHTVASTDGRYNALTDATVTVKVTDDDAAPPPPPPDPPPPPTPTAQFASSSASVDEDIGTHDVTVSLSPAPASAITVSYTLSGTATRGSDYTISGVTSSQGSLRVAANQASATIPVSVVDDQIMDSGETVVVTLTSGQGYNLGTQHSYTLTINNDDPPPPDPLVPDPPTPPVADDPGTGGGGQGPSAVPPGNAGSSSALSAPPRVEIRLGDPSPAAVSMGESSVMTVELDRMVRGWVRVFVEIDSTAELTGDYTVDADVGDGWFSLGDNPRRLVFDLPSRDTDALVRVTSRDAGRADASAMLTVSIGDRTFAAGSVAKLVPMGSAEITALRSPNAQSAAAGAVTVAVAVGSDDADTDSDSAAPLAVAPSAASAAPPADDDAADAVPQAGAAGQTADGSFVSYTVQPGDTLSAIALTFYRDEHAWQRILDANRGRRQNDGCEFTGPDTIRAGWTIRIPTPIAAPSAAAAADAPFVTYSVAAGDSLRTISRRIYGDAALYNRIVLANRGRRQADGTVFVHGDAIRAGWLLRIPLAGA
ncbi:MAG: LysM peptidoglycan-binding domain-containing protein [Acidimicrobiaceae bacterium]|nr:LysM peptidoglycan-binding domain-containing protein [Acidimicrobiaceae bacterium]